jgi:hypothetical protein
MLMMAAVHGNANKTLLKINTAWMQTKDGE